MKTSLSRSLLAAILALSVNAQAFQPQLEIIEQFDDLNLVAFISSEDMSSNPQWEPGAEKPPLAVEDAIGAVMSFVKSPEPVKEIEIRQVPGHEKQWHYLVKTVNHSLKAKYSLYVVLMNGKVLPGLIEPQGYK